MSNPSQEARALTVTFGLPWPDLNDGLFYKDVVRASDSELTVIQFYSKKYKNSAPLQGWLQRIQNGQITIDGGVVRDPSTTLSEQFIRWTKRQRNRTEDLCLVEIGSELVYHRLPWKEPDAPHWLEIIYEDDDMIALNKPSGLQVLPGGLFQQRTVLTQLLWRATKLSPSLMCHEPHPTPVHRLGRGTSGLLLCAKTKLAKTQLAAYFADGTSHIGGSSKTSSELGTVRKILKIYRALVTGIVCENKVNVNQPIGIVQYPGVAKGLYVASPSGKPALSKVEVLERDRNKNCTLVQVEIQSGRPHQIRIHLAFIGHPLLGDPLYVVGGGPQCSDSEYVDDSFALDGGFLRPTKPVPGDCGYSLHAHQVTLSHITTNELIIISAPLPPNLRTRKEVQEIGMR
ncbi:RNA pseudouridine synthase 5 isoform X2 [Humulus lupulus]|uniref:RNA pseudouridine synthase 5 isoform X2 n=1 Tax=Humulus lupulus TaxID=3486 RepID=UPI002B413F86|nr:RNA pseudouridine synthase 5 isoform X2 [Humulus lupulus]